MKAWGTGTPVWSPDGSKFAFVSNRIDHSLIGVYTLRTRRVTFLAPSVDHDSSPTWSPDGKRVAFIRSPGTPFGQQAHQGSGSIGNPDGPAYNPLTALRSGGRGSGQGRGGGRGRGQAEPAPTDRPGLFDAAFSGGYALAFVVADVATGEGNEFWHNQKNDKEIPAVAAILLGRRRSRRVRRRATGVGAWYSVPIAATAGAGRPIELTPGDGAVEQVALSADGRFLVYATNAGDIERRHVWKVPTAGGTAGQLTKGETIETYPAVLPSGHVAVLGGDAKRPFGVGLVPASGGAAKYIYPSLAQFPIDAEVVPQLVLTKAADGIEIHNQLFLPKDMKPGEKRPAHRLRPRRSGSGRCCSATTTCSFYHVAYGVNQWLAGQGYVVMSVNYRSGVGYGRSFRTAPNTGGARQRGVSGRARRRQVSADAARRRSEPRRHLGPVVRRRADGAGARAQLGHLQGRRRSRRRAPLGQLARSGQTSRTSRRRSRRSTAGSRRCC